MPKKLTTLFVIALLAIGAGIARAEPVAFQVDQMAIDASIDAGASKTGVITVSNVAQATPTAPAAPVHLRVYAVDWTLDRSGKPVFAKPGTLPDSCTTWLQISPIELTIPAGQSQQIRYTINVPAGVQGSFRTMIMFETAPPPASTSGQRVMVINGRIGSALYLAVGPQARRLRVDAFGVTAKDTTFTLENTGNEYVRLKGKVEYQDANNQVVQDVTLPGAVVLPQDNNQRDFDLATPKLLSGTYTATLIVDYGGSVLIGARTHVTIP